MKTIILALLVTLSLQADEAKALYTKCAGCHGMNGEKKAMNVSQVITELSKEDIAKAIRGYQTGTYGKSMGVVMRGQVARLNEEQITMLASHIASLKK